MIGEKFEKCAGTYFEDSGFFTHPAASYAYSPGDNFGRPKKGAWSQNRDGSVAVAPYSAQLQRTSNDEETCGWALILFKKYHIAR